MSLVAIVGRPNVGKSTLFNRLVGQRQAIVDSTAGTTRDRHYGRTDWNGKEFSVIDTGGYTVNSEDIFEDEIRRQVLLAIDEADVILFLVEVSTGITDLDMMMADILRRSSKKVLLICNKVDNNDQIYLSHEFYSLGLGDPYCISSMSGSGTGDMMDAILEALPEDVSAEEEDELPRITRSATSSPRLPAPRATRFARATTSSAWTSIWSTRPACARRARRWRTSSSTRSCAPSAPSRIPTSAS